MFNFSRRHAKASSVAKIPSTTFLTAGEQLVETLAQSLAPYLEYLVTLRLAEQHEPTDQEKMTIARYAVILAQNILDELRVFIGCDVDEQRTTPLEIVRAFVAPMNKLCHEFGLKPVRRDRFLADRFPKDDFDLTPANLAVLGDDVGEAALLWGAAKAFEHKHRHQTHERKGPIR